MASVPNMRPAAATPAGEAPAAAEGEKGDLFARILSLAPVAAPAAQPVAIGDAAPEAAPEGKPVTGEDEQSDSADAVALTVPLPPTDLIPLVAAQAATPVVASAVVAQATTKVVAHPVPVAELTRARPALARNAGAAPDSAVPMPVGKPVVAVANMMPEQPVAAAAKAVAAEVTVARTDAPTSVAVTPAATGNQPRVAGVPATRLETAAPEAAASTDKPAGPAIVAKAAADPIATTPHIADARNAKIVPPATPDGAPRQKLHIRTGAAAAPAFASPAATRASDAEPQAVPTIAVPPRPDAATIQPAVPTAIAAQIGKLASAESPDPEAPAVEAPAVERAEIRKPGKPVVASTPTAARLVGSATPLPIVAAASVATAAPAPISDSAGEVASRAEATPVPAAPRLDIAQPAFAPQSAAAPASAQVEPAKPADTLGHAIERELHLVRDSAWFDQLARDIARTADGDGSMRFKLHPQTLGHLRVEVAQTDQGTTVRFTAETESARTLLADAQPRLAAEARAHGVRIAESHVDLADSGHDAPRDSRRQDAARAEPQIRTAAPAQDRRETPGEARRVRTDRFA